MKENIRWISCWFNELTLEQLYDTMQLRQEVFVVEQDAAYLDADGRDLPARHILGYSQDQLLAYARILPPALSYKEASIGRVVTAPSARRKGLGKELMTKALSDMESTFQTKACRISAQTYLIPFYNAFGFEVVSEEYLEDGLPHHEMLRKA